MTLFKNGFLKRAAERLDDALNPIVVKELRQAVEGKFVVGVLLIFLLISLATVSVFLLMSNPSNVDFNAGGMVFLSLQGIVLGTCLLFLPLYVGIRIAAERSDTNVDLLFITTIPPRAIVWGKLLVTVILAVLIYSACMPFMMLAVFLRGVDLPTVSILLVLGFLVVAASIQIGIFAASVTSHRGFRIFLGLALVASICFMFGTTMSFSTFSVQRGMGSLMDTWEFWGVALTFLDLWLSAVVCLYVWSVALIKPPSANRALPVRLTLMGVWALNGIAAGLWTYFTKEEEFIFAWGLSGVGFFGLGLLMAICEREEWGPRVARTIPRSRILRLPAFLLYSGSAGGLAWACVMAAVSLAAAFLVATMQPPERFERIKEGLQITGGLFLYAFCYSMTALLIRRHFLRALLKPAHTWALAIAVGALSTSLPPIAAFFTAGVGPRNTESQWWLVPGPFALMMTDATRDAGILFTGLWAILFTLLSLPWFYRQVRAFRPPRAPGELERALPLLQSQGR